MTHLFLSPHLDDVVYSCGGMIHQQIQTGDSVAVVTICAADPPCNSVSAFAREIHGLCRPSSAASPAEMVAARRWEDLRALESLGAQAVHLDIPDCIYRVHPADGSPLYTTATDLMGNIHPSEPALIRSVAARLARLRRSAGTHHFYAPLAIGCHVDHQLGRRAAEVIGGIHAYYEDFPYVADAPDGPAERRACWPHGRLLRPEMIFLTPANLKARWEAMGCYASQVTSFWPNRRAMQKAVKQFTERTGGGAPAERLWRVA
jgi:LmbE family N-acetylglucosaminyl deacetylase